MHRHLFSYLFIALLLLLDTSATSFAATVLYAQTVGGAIYKSTDSAKTWQKLFTETSAALGSAAVAVDPQNSNNLYSIYNPGKLPPGSTLRTGVFRSTDGGQTWVETLTQVSAPIVVDGTAGNIVYAFGSNHGIYRSTDSGVSFQAITVVAGSTGGIEAIRNDPSQPGTVYTVVSGSGKGIYKSTDYGATWALFTSSSTVFGNGGGSMTDLAIDPKNSSVLYVAAYSSTCGTSTASCGLLKSTDAGKTWQAIFGDNFANVVVDPRNGNIYAGGYLGTLVPGATPGGEIVKSTDGGKTFTRITSGLTSAGAEVHLDPESPNVLYGSQSRTVGVYQGIKPASLFVSTDAGATWTLGQVDAALTPPNDEIYSLVAVTAPSAAPPTITQGGVVPIYSSVPVIQAGSWISIYGTNLGNGTSLWNGDFPTTLGGVSVTINNKPAYLWVVTPTQINLQAPDDPATGTVSVVVTTGSGTASATSTVTLGQYGPSFSVLDGKHVAGVIATPDGSGAYGGGTYDLAGPSGAFTFKTRPVKAGETLILYGVGFGPTTPAVPAGKVFSGAASTNSSVTITLGGVNANVAFAGITQAGLYQFNLTVPSTSSGDQPLQAFVNGAQTQAGPVVTVQ